MDTYRIIIADDDALFRLGFEELISSHPEFKITSIYRDGGTLWSHLDAIDCEILVLDINMHGVNGLQILEQVRIIHPQMKVLILSVMPKKFMHLKHIN